MLLKLRGTFIEFRHTSDDDGPRGPQRSSSAPASHRPKDSPTEMSYLSSLSKFLGDHEDVSESPDSPPGKSQTIGTLPFLTLKAGKEDGDGVGDQQYAIESMSTLSLSSLPPLSESMRYVSESLSSLPEIGEQTSARSGFATESPSSLPEHIESARSGFATESLSSLPEHSEFALESTSLLPEFETEAVSPESKPAPHTSFAPHISTDLDVNSASSEGVSLTVGDRAVVITVNGALADADKIAAFRKAIAYCNSHSESIWTVFLWFAAERGAAVASPNVHGLVREVAKELLELAQPVVGLVAASLATVMDTMLLASCSQVIATQDAQLYVESNALILCFTAAQAVELGLVGHLVGDIQELNDNFSELRARCSSGATSLMLCNVPCRLTQPQLEEVLLETGFGNAYDCIYFPASGGSPNLGYVFVNFVTAQLAAKFMVTFHHYRFKSTHSTKHVQVKIAKVQGRAAMIQQLNWRAAAPGRNITRKMRQKQLRD